MPAELLKVEFCDSLTSSFYLTLTIQFFSNISAAVYCCCTFGVCQISYTFVFHTPPDAKLVLLFIIAAIVIHTE